MDLGSVENGPPGRGGVTITLTDEWPLETSVDDLENLMGRFERVNVHIGGRAADSTEVGPEDTDPSFERVKAFLDWWEKHSRDPDFEVSAYRTVRRTPENDD